MAPSSTRLTYADLEAVRPGDRFEPVPAHEDGAIQSRVLPDLKIKLNDAFSGVELTEK